MSPKEEEEHGMNKPRATRGCASVYATKTKSDRSESDTVTTNDAPESESQEKASNVDPAATLVADVVEVFH